MIVSKQRERGVESRKCELEKGKGLDLAANDDREEAFWREG